VPNDVSILPPLLQAVPVGIASIDLAGRVLDVNRELLGASGYTSDEFRGAPFLAFLDPGEHETASAAFAALVTGERDGYRAVHRCRTRAGELRDVDISVSLVRGETALPEMVLAVLQDVTLRLSAEEQRRQATELLQLVVQQSGEAIVVADADAVLRVFNPAAERLYGVAGAPTPAEEWSQRYRLFRVDGTPLPYEETALFRAVKGQTVRDARWLVRRPDGVMRTLVGSSAPLRRPDATPAGAVLIARDETDRLAAEEEREALLVQTQVAHRDLQAASRLKDEFLATLSHELRTPLNAILGWTRILRSQTFDPQTTHALDVIERNAVAQARLIDDLLDVSRIITGKIRLQIETLDLPAILANALETVRPAAEAKGVRLEAHVPDGLPPVTGDPQRLQQVFWNLLSNAVKFTGTGGRVTLSAAQDGPALVTTVADTGSGITPSILPFVFDRFTQADVSTTRMHAGLGLGLAIVRHLVELHGGTATAESPGEGHGATFRIRIPLTRDGASR
jgi:PAS domain S-box-containing protein